MGKLKWRSNLVIAQQWWARQRNRARKGKREKKNRGLYQLETWITGISK